MNVINSRAEQDTHPLASLLQASNFNYLEISAMTVPYRRSPLTMWVLVSAIRRTISTLNAMADFHSALRGEIQSAGLSSALRQLPTIYAQTSDDAVIRRSLEEEKRNYSQAQSVWRQL